MLSSSISVPASSLSLCRTDMALTSLSSLPIKSLNLSPTFNPNPPSKPLICCFNPQNATSTVGILLRHSNSFTTSLIYVKHHQMLQTEPNQGDEKHWSRQPGRSTKSVYVCQNNTGFANPTYTKTKQVALNALAGNVGTHGGFYHTSAGNTSTTPVNSLALCSGDIGVQDCDDCVKFFIQELHNTSTASDVVEFKTTPPRYLHVLNP